MFLDVLKNAFVNWHSIVQNISIVTKDDEWIHVKIDNWSLVPTEYVECQTINLVEESMNKTPRFVLMYFNKIADIGVLVRIDDREKKLRKRGLRSQIMDYDGIPIKIEDLSSAIIRKYFLTFSQRIYLDTEEGIDCVNYPDGEYRSYQDCDENFVYNKMKNEFKIMPFWAAKSLDEVTNLT